MVSEHPQERMLDKLPRRTRRQQRLALRLPRLRDRVTAGNSLRVAALGLREKITAHENRRATSSGVEVPGSESFKDPALPPPPLLVARYPLDRGASSVPWQWWQAERVLSIVASRWLPLSSGARWTVVACPVQPSGYPATPGNSSEETGPPAVATFPLKRD
jgi:hypothetical protein